MSGYTKGPWVSYGSGVATEAFGLKPDRTHGASVHRHDRRDLEGGRGVTTYPTPDRAQLDRMLARLKLGALKRKQWERFDKCCHGGIVSYRLPLMFRLGVANRVVGALSR